jgi:hypothetical protein
VDLNIPKYGIKEGAELTKLPLWLRPECAAIREIIKRAQRKEIKFCHDFESIMEILHTTSVHENIRINSLLGEMDTWQVIETPFEHRRILGGMLPSGELDTKKLATERMESELDIAISQFPRLREIHESLGKNKKADAYHIWAAEYGKANYFLTVDKALINSARNQKRTHFTAEIVFPSEFITKHAP